MPYLVMHKGIMEGIYLSPEKAQEHVVKARSPEHVVWVENHGEFTTEGFKVVYWSDSIGTGEHL